MKELERSLKALANRRRLAILKLIKEKREKTVSELARDIDLSIKSTSRHLAVLLGADVVEREQRGLEMYYRLSKQHNSATRHILTLL